MFVNRFGVLVFHVALTHWSQDPFVILTFGSVIFHNNWEDGLRFAKENVQNLVTFDPETVNHNKFTSDNEIAEKVMLLAMLVEQHIGVLLNKDILHDIMDKIYPDFPCSKSVSSFN